MSFCLGLHAYGVERVVDVVGRFWDVIEDSNGFVEYLGIEYALLVPLSY